MISHAILYIIYADLTWIYEIAISNYLTIDRSTFTNALSSWYAYKVYGILNIDYMAYSYVLHLRHNVKSIKKIETVLFLAISAR